VVLFSCKITFNPFGVRDISFFWDPLIASVVIHVKALWAYWMNTQLLIINHFQHIGSTESLRNFMMKALLLKQPAKIAVV
jgi:hypothetical protein